MTSERQNSEALQACDQVLGYLNFSSGAFDAGLLERPRLIVGTKVDVVDEARRAELSAAVASRGLRYMEISSVTHTGLDPLLEALQELLAGDVKT